MGNLDSFPRGGQDFELSVFLLLTLLCMSLLAALGGRGLAERIVSEQTWELHDFWSVTLGPVGQGSSAPIVWIPPKQPFFGGSVPLPLRI